MLNYEKENNAKYYCKHDQYCYIKRLVARKVQNTELQIKRHVKNLTIVLTNKRTKMFDS